MEKQILRHVSALVLVLSVLFSCFGIPSYAADPATISAGVAAVGAIKEATELSDSVTNAIIDAVDFTFPLYDQIDDAKQFYNCISNFNVNGWFRRALVDYPDVWETVKIFYSMTVPDSVPNKYLAKAKLDESMQCYRPAIKNPNSNSFPVNYIWLVDKNGRFPCCPKDVYEAVYPPDGSSGTVTPSTPKPFDGRWLTTNSIRDSKKTVQKSYADMDATKADLANKYPNSSISISTLVVGGLTCKVIRRLEEGPGNRDWVWCHPNGQPFVFVDPDTQGSAQDWNYDKIQDITNNQTEEITNIVTEQGDKIDKLIEINNDTSEMKVNVPVQVGPNEWSLLTMNADQITIDRSEDNRTIYQIDSHDVTYNVENNYYEYNYYTYNFEYTYNNTYVTYIGSTAEYQPKEWALYYELPDGRSSADLTEEDIAGLSFQFQDMVNYKRSATDTSLRALYHFDGNTEDSSYWSTQGAFTWNSGASITYMESNAFNGALYLDEKAHQFTITLPSSIGSQDFSLQWRYYQNSATTTDHNENYVTVGGTKLLGWSEQKLYNGSGTSIAGLSVGTWQELALIREKGTLYTYHNGVKVASASVPTVFNDKIVFYLGANSRAYSMLDELRVVNFAVTKGGAAYTPTAVPYDTNSVLVLPDGVEPVADEFWKWDTAITPIYAWDLTSGYIDAPEYYAKNGSVTSWTVNSSKRPGTPLESGSWFFTSGTVNAVDGFISLVNSSSSVLASKNNYGSSGTSYTIRFDGSGIGLLLCLGNLTTFPYTVTVVGRDNQRYSLVVPQSSSFPTATFDWGSMTCGRRFYYTGSDSWNGENTILLFDLNPNTTLDIVYVEVVPGEQPNTGHEFINAIYSSDELQPNTAAIQSTIPVKGYTVGGVRPTFPERGDVWMPVEGSRISSVYIYNGQAWEETNARYWTGKRWIPIYAFDLVTLADMWDVGSSTGGDVSPSISSEYGFWNWWKGQWLEFRQWLADNLGSGGGGGSIVFPQPSECEHTYVEKILTSPTCTQKGTALYICTKCGDSYTDTIDASGHDWIMKESIPDELDEETGEVVTAGYDLYRCSICGEEYKDFARTGPPGAESGSTLSELIQQLFGALGDIVGSLIDWILDLGKEAMEGFGSLGEFFEEKAEEVQGFGGEYVGFLGVFFEAIPEDIKTCISLALLLFGLSLFVRKVIL